MTLSPVTYIKSIPIDVPLTMIMTRLGYRNSKTVLTGVQREQLEKTIADGFALCQPQGCWRRIPVVGKKDAELILQGGSVLNSLSLMNFLKNSFAVVFMATTVGPAIVDAASEAMAQGDGVKAVIYDAIGGQSADAAMNWLNELVRRQLSRSGERLTVHRFSAGFGDFALDNQKVIHAFLNLDRLGISLTSRYMLIPEKSVTSVAGIEKASPVEEKL